MEQKYSANCVSSPTNTRFLSLNYEHDKVANDILRIWSATGESKCDRNVGVEAQHPFPLFGRRYFEMMVLESKPDE